MGVALPLGMAVLSRSRIVSHTLSVLSLTLVLGAVAAVDESVRARFGALLAGDFSNGLGWASDLTHRALTTLHAVQFQATAHQPLVFFGVGAAVLVLLMRRG